MSMTHSERSAAMEMMRKALSGENAQVLTHEGLVEKAAPEAPKPAGEAPADKSDTEKGG